MSDNGNTERGGDQSTEEYSKVNQPAESETESVPYSREEWESLPSDPDPVRNLGYDPDDWEEFETHDGSGQVMFLPGEEEQIRNDAFVVADRESVADLAGNR